MTTYRLTARARIEPDGEWFDLDMTRIWRCIRIARNPLWAVQLGWVLTGYAIWKALQS